MTAAPPVVRAIHRLKASETSLIGDCLHAAARGPFFLSPGQHPDAGDFHSIFGIWLDELIVVSEAWPNVGRLDPEVVDLAVNNSLNNLLGYPHGRMDAWVDFVSGTPDEVREALVRWARLMKRNSPTGYFSAMR